MKTYLMCPVHTPEKLEKDNISADMMDSVGLEENRGGEIARLSWRYLFEKLAVRHVFRPQ